MIHFEEKQFNEIFPFFIVIRRDLIIKIQGTSSKKIIGDVIGKNVFDVFEFVRPRLSIQKNFDSLLSNKNTVIILKNNQKKVNFRGQFIYDETNDLIYYLNSPWLINTNEFEDRNLKINDFAIHDTVTDNIQLLRTKEIVNDDLKKINDNLLKNQAELIITNQKLEEAEEQYKVLVENSSEIIYRVNSVGKFEYVNPTSTTITGYSKDELIGKDYDILIREDYKIKLANFYKFQLEQKIKTTYIEFPIITKNKEELWLGQSVNLQFMTDHEFEYLVMARDITERKRSEKALIKSEEKYRSILENLELGLVEADKNNIIVKAYPKFCEMVGYSEEELLWKDNFDLLLDEEAKQVMHEQNIKRVKGQASVYELQLTRKDKSKIWCLISGAPYYDLNDEFQGTVGIHVDITERKQLEQELINAKLTAEKSLKTRELFMANMSHEIRTPLNAIIGMTEVLLKSKLTNEQEKFLKVVATSSENLLLLINDILNFSKIESGKIELDLKEIDIYELLNVQKNLFYLKAKEKDIDLDLSIGKIKNKYFIDGVRLGEIVSNLISNAIKFTSLGHVKIACSIISYGKTHDTILFEISDTGIGIPKNKQESIFDYFTQEDETINTKYGGTGLGLSICKKLVELMGGSISIQSQVGKGSTFSFSLKFKKGSKLTSKAKELENQDNHKENYFNNEKILLVDDNELNLLVAKSMMEKWNLSIFLANNGKEALEMLKNISFDLILMDIRMPVMDGIEATAIIRNKLKKEIPIVALTANIEEKEIEKYISIGMNDYLTKPFKSVQLAKLLEKHLSNKAENLIDLTELKKAFGDNEEISNKMIQLFLETAPSDLEKIKYAFKNKETKIIQQVAHKMKPSLYYISKRELSELAKKIELENSDQVFLMCNEFIHLVEEFLKQLKVFQN